MIRRRIPLNRRLAVGLATGLATALTLALGAAPAAAQEGAPLSTAPSERGLTAVSSLGVWSAVARDEPLPTRVGHTHDRDLYIIGMRAAWPLASGRLGRLEYTADLLPAVVATEIPTYDAPHVSPCSRPGPCPLRTTREELATRTVYGAGLVPLGVQWRVGGDRRVNLLVRTSAGAVWFTEPVPDPAERRLNFTLDAGALLDVRLTGSVALSAGWRLNHLSNGGAGPVNPGMNSRMLEVGLVRRR